MSGNTLYSKQIWLTLILLSNAQLQCGGKQTPESAESDSCRETYTQILNKKNDEICDPTRISFFEIQVIQWQDDCSEQARGALGEKVSYKLFIAQECSEKKRQSEKKRSECNARLVEAERELGCLGNECAPYQDNLNEIAKDCDTPALNQTFLKEISKLRERIEERTNEADRLLATTEIIALCDQYVEITGEKRAAAAYNRMLQKVTDDPFIRQVPKEGSEADRLRKEALATCDRGILLALEVILPAVSKKIEGTIQYRRKKREIAKLTAMQKRMAAADGAALFPNADALLDKTVQQYASQTENEIIMPERIDKKAPEPTVQAKSEIVVPERIDKKAPEPTVQAKSEIVVPERIDKKAPEPTKRVPLLPDVTESADTTAVFGEKQESVAAEEPAAPTERTAAQDRDFMTKSANRCKELRKDSAYFFSKTAEYKKKNSQNKMSLYQSNLDNTNKALEALSTEIKKVAKSTALPSDEREKLLKRLKELGCLMEE